MSKLKAWRLTMAGAWLAGAVLCAGHAGAVGAQGASGNGAPAAYEARGQAAAERSRRLRVEQHRQMERTAAHARMADTMYASTPDTSVPPHGPCVLALEIHLREGVAAAALPGVRRFHLAPDRIGEPPAPCLELLRRVDGAEDFVHHFAIAASGRVWLRRR